jgi:hypothetical protein
VSLRSDIDRIDELLVAGLPDLERIWAGEQPASPATSAWLLLSIRDVRSGSPFLNAQSGPGVFEESRRLLSIESHTQGGAAAAADQSDRVRQLFRDRREADGLEFDFPETGEPAAVKFAGRSFLRTAVFVPFLSRAMFALPAAV